MPSRSSTRSSRLGARRLAAVITLTAAAAGAATACSHAVRALGPDVPAARANADGLFLGLATRFGPHSRDADLKSVRPRLLGSFLTPTKIWRDETMWSSSQDSTRTLAIGGSMRDDGYVLAMLPAVERPSRPGMARHLMHLTRLGEDIYEWESTDQLAIGTVRAQDLYLMVTRALSALEGHDDETLRSAIPLAFPTATAALGRLFAIEILETQGLDDGSTFVTAGVRMDPAQLKKDAPRLAQYLERYVSSAKYSVHIEDDSGTPWFQARVNDGLLTLRWRTHGGKLQPFEGPIREAPAVFRLRASAAVKVFLFTVGAEEVAGELRVIDGPSERGWEIALREEPDWHLPVGSERLLRSPLRRPFEGDGALLRYVARDSAGAQTLLVRDIRGQVQESAILRFLNSLGNKMASDLDEPTEAELQRFTSDAILALHRDVMHLLPREAAITDGKSPGGAR